MVMRFLDYARDNISVITGSTGNLLLINAAATSYFPLQQLQEHGAMSTVHLDMMELEGNR